MKHLDRFFYGFLLLALLGIFIALVGAVTSFVMAYKIPCLIVGFGVPAIYFLGWALHLLIGEER